MDPNKPERSPSPPRRRSRSVSPPLSPVRSPSRSPSPTRRRSVLVEPIRVRGRSPRPFEILPTVRESVSEVVGGANPEDEGNAGGNAEASDASDAEAEAEGEDEPHPSKSDSGVGLAAQEAVMAASGSGIGNVPVEEPASPEQRVIGDVLRSTCPNPMSSRWGSTPSDQSPLLSPDFLAPRVPTPSVSSSLELYLSSRDPSPAESRTPTPPESLAPPPSPSSRHDQSPEEPRTPTLEAMPPPAPPSPSSTEVQPPTSPRSPALFSPQTPTAGSSSSGNIASGSSSGADMREQPPTSSLPAWDQPSTSTLPAWDQPSTSSGWAQVLVRDRVRDFALPENFIHPASSTYRHDDNGYCRPSADTLWRQTQTMGALELHPRRVAERRSTRVAPKRKCHCCEESPSLSLRRPKRQVPKKRKVFNVTAQKCEEGHETSSASTSGSTSNTDADDEFDPNQVD